MISLFTGIIRRFLTGRDARYIFKKSGSPKCGPISKINLYIHIPFCKSFCPYCPYNKIEYDKKLAGEYLQAMLKEIALYRNLLGSTEISSVYIGGGTPTLLMDELGKIIGDLNSKFSITGDICIETNPNDITGSIMTELKAANISLVSVGVQSFQDEYLRFIGRKYGASGLCSTIEKLTSANFKSVNIDLMFALPKQSIADVTYDLEMAIKSEVNQITAYPLFTFPYSSIGRYLKIKMVRMPDLRTRRKMYYHIYNYLLDKGFNRVSVWGFKKGSAPRYSSVTRDNYIGLGAGAGSHTANGFYLNTFRVEEYIKRCNSYEFPTALHMNFNQPMQNYFWLYWRLYDTYIPKKGLFEFFGRRERKLNRILAALTALKLAEEEEEGFRLTREGAFWIHLLQNYFSLRYIDKIWSVAMNEAFPERIVL